MGFSLDAIAIDTQKIRQSILNSPHDSNPGLFNGELGKSMFCLTDFKYTADRNSFDYAVSSINASINLFNAFESKALLLSLTEGLPGLRYALNAFKAFDALDSDDLESEIDLLILNEISNKSEVFNLIGYDLLYGITGIANVYLTIPASKVRDRIIETICQILSENLILNRGEHILKDKFGFGVHPFNLGMAHGLLAIVSLLSKVVKLSGDFRKYKEMLQGVVRWYLANENSNELNSRFPCTVNETGFSENRTNRLAWCYGDLSSAIAMLQAGLALNEPILIKKSLAICESTLDRREVEMEVDTDGSLIYDCGLCHGLAGITHTYFYLSNFFKTKELNQAYEFWHQQLLYRCVNTQNHQYAGCFKIERLPDQPSKSYPKLSLLEGASGVGLVHLAALKTNSDSLWNHLFV